ncbi:MAG: ATP-binding protein [Richelia sp. RM1_1_1]|nr:ATP-binding protein [Richelia sp. RM1_1_1]
MPAIKINHKQLIKTNYKTIAHFLIGTPASGKSTFAQLLSQLGNYQIISTDDIRKQLYGDAKIQGEWFKIESIAIDRIITELKLGKSIIYDATNFKRCFRMDFLSKVNARLTYSELPQLNWVGWYLQTPLQTCIEWNQKRQRQVGLEIIETMHKLLQESPPISSEGFAVVNKINVTLPQLQLQIKNLIAKIPRQIVNSQNRLFRT